MILSLVAGFLMMPTPVLGRGEWLTDWEKAKRYAAALGRPILANFTGSDWCPYCLRLREGVFEKPLFLDWAEEEVVLFEADFPRGKELPEQLVAQNEALQTEFGASAFPTVVFVTAGGDLLGRSGFLGNGGARYWLEHAEAQMNAGREKLAASGGGLEIVGKPMGATDFRGKAAPELDWGTRVWGPEPVRDGKPVLIDFWATWCGPCVKEMPKLNRWAEKFGDELLVVGVTDEEADKVERFASRYEIGYSLTSDPERKLGNTFGVKQIPYMVLVGRDGTVLWQGTVNDGDPLTEAMIRRVIDSGK
jgi:thiol-disulfide isomerase/thioredoxin